MINLTNTERIEILEKDLLKALGLINKQADYIIKLFEANVQLMEFRKLIMDERQKESDLWDTHFNQKISNDQAMAEFELKKKQFFNQ